MAADGAGASSRIYEKVQDYQVYWTASFYIAAPRVPRCVMDVLRAPAKLREIYKADLASRRLADAINPLFNDIADRERAGRVDDFLFAAGERQGDEVRETWIDLDMPNEVQWTTEGLTTTATPPDPIGAQKLRVRRFWYVHRNGAVSWHVSFLLDYGPVEAVREKMRFDRSLGLTTEDFWHTPSLLYFLSRLQKALAPKEFGLPKGAVVDANVRVHRHPNGQTGIDPIDKTWVRESTRDAAVQCLVEECADRRTLWHQISQWFGADVEAFFDQVCPFWRETLAATCAKRADQIALDPFEALVGPEPFMEVPGLQMPRFRYMFFFVDYTFFNRLLPPLAEDGRRLMPRSRFVHENCYAPYLRKNQELTKDDGLNLDASFWNWVAERGDTAGEVQRVKDRLAELEREKGVEIDFDKWLEGYKKDKPAWKDNRRPDCLNYLFLSGFNQNIIDFMAQDASEILDSLDPIYPDTDDDSAERFFVRYATPRGFLTYVSGSRSLEAGNDHIGTCPYAFLTHVLALHNEYLARDYEINTETMIDEIEALNASDQAWKAVERFHAFRTGEFSDYARDRYGSVFRYNTESDVFAAVEQARGIARKTEYLNTIVENLEKQSADLQARLQKREDREVTYAVGAVGAFGLFSLVFDLIGATREVQGLQPVTWLFWVTVALTAGLAAVIVWRLLHVLVRDLHEDMAQKLDRTRIREAMRKEWLSPDAYFQSLPIPPQAALQARGHSDGRPKGPAKRERPKRAAIARRP